MQQSLDLQHLARRAYASKRYQDALQLYLQAYEQQQQQQQQPGNAAEKAILASNCAAALLKLDHPRPALHFAEAATQARPDWPKAWYRLAAAHSALQQYSQAAQALKQAAALLTADQATEARDVQDKLFAVASHEHHQSVQAGLQACHVAWATTSAREARGREAMVQQLQQSIAGCSWEPQDLEWRPTWTPSMRWHPIIDGQGAAGKAAAVSGTVSQPQCLLQELAADPSSSQYLGLLAGLTQSLAELEAPQRALKLLQDEPLLAWYMSAIEEAVAEKGSDATVLVLSHGGGGLLGLLAAAAGARQVVVVERGCWGFRAAQQLLDDTRHSQVDLVGRVQLVPCNLSCVRCAAGGSGGEGSQEGAAGIADAAGDDDGCYWLAQAADVVVTDLFDYSVLGQGVLPTIATAAAAGLLAADVLVVPHQVRLLGQLVDSLLPQPVAGFDLAAVNSYKLHATLERLDNGRHKQLQRLSPATELHTLQLHRWALEKGALSCLGAATVLGTCSLEMHPGGVADALLVWCELKSKAGSLISSAAPEQGRTSSSSLGMGLFYLDAPLRDVTLTTGSTAAARVRITTSQQHQLRLHFSARAGGCMQQSVQATGMAADAPAASEAADGLVRVPAASGSLRQGSCSWSPHGEPRHASLPRWHFDMLSDVARNSSYDTAIRRAITRVAAAKHAAGLAGDAADVTALDVGTGTGLLAMMAVRAGAARVTAVESVRHLAQAATAIVAANGLSSRIDIIHKDGRYIKLAQDIRRPADLLAFEVFDCGLIGEGALHIVAAARPLLGPGATILPAAAKVYCQPIQFRRVAAAAATSVCDPHSLFRYGWQPDYFEADLQEAVLSAGSSCQTLWQPLAAPQLAFTFDFGVDDPVAAFQPCSRPLMFTADSGGICNAVAFWFELELDEHTRLSSSPYRTASEEHTPTWRQAVQMLPEHSVAPGQVLQITAQHDTYAISFAANGTACSTAISEPASSAAAAAAAQDNLSPLHRDGPLFDPLWRQAYDRVMQVQATLAKAMSQDPTEYMRLATAATLLAMRPWGRSGNSSVGRSEQQLTWPSADPHHASALLMRLMG